MDFEDSNTMNLRYWVRVWIRYTWFINFLNNVTNFLVPSNSRNSLSLWATSSLSVSLYRSAYELRVTSRAVDLFGRKRDELRVTSRVVDLSGRKRDDTYHHRPDAASDAAHVAAQMQRRIRLEALYCLLCEWVTPCPHCDLFATDPVVRRSVSHSVGPSISYVSVSE